MLTLPWPLPELSPNARAHHMAKARAAKAYKDACWILTKERCWAPDLDKYIHLKITFYPPSRRRMDLDNMLASIKHGLDGVAHAWGIDDSQFRPITVDVADKIGGYITVEVEPVDTNEKVI